ncbi:unnamed protein product [Colias eurytheme]|nr:unnamed protein product [Colias eurytheme]
MDRIITFKEVRKHRKQDSVWIVIHDEVYDVTAYLEEHPGGENTLLDYAGQDGTQAFEDFGHSEDAREIMKKFKIGILAPEEKTSFLEQCKPPERKCDTSAPSTPRAERRVQSIVVPRERRPPGPPCGSSKLKWAVLALAGAVVIGFALKKYLNK